MHLHKVVANAGTKDDARYDFRACCVQHHLYIEKALIICSGPGLGETPLGLSVSRYRAEDMSEYLTAEELYAIYTCAMPDLIVVSKHGWMKKGQPIMLDDNEVKGQNITRS